MDLEKLLNEDINFVPPQYRKPGVDTDVINTLLTHAGYKSIYEYLYPSMNSATENAFHKTLEWHLEIQRDEHYALARQDIEKQRRQIQENLKRIFPEGIGKAADYVYKGYLISNGVPMRKLNRVNQTLVRMDSFLAFASGRKMDPVEPDGVGPYMFAVYPVRKVLRYFMLKGAEKN